jgi:hypothetical protein
VGGPPQSYSMRWLATLTTVVAQPRRRVLPRAAGDRRCAIRQNRAGFGDGRVVWDSGLRHWSSWRA